MSSAQNQGGSGKADQPETNRPASRIVPFTVEMGDSRNRTISISALRLRLRGSWRHSVFVGPRGGRDIGSAMNKMPDIPGQCVEITSNSVRIFDPLGSDKHKETLALANRAADDAQAIRSGAQKWSPVEESIQRVGQEIDADTLKTVVIELIQLVKEKSATVVDGVLPDLKEIEAMPGHQIFDPWSNSNDKPRYVKDKAAWEDRHDRLIAAGARA